jgi:hypothetical protein
MPQKPKPVSEQSRRFIERADEIGADATEEQFTRTFRKIIPPKIGKPSVTGRHSQKKKAH